MSINELTQFPYIPSEIYSKYRAKNKLVIQDLTSIKQGIEKLLNNSKKGDKLAQLILMDFYLSVNHELVYKDNITGKRIEIKLSKLFALTTGDEMPRVNPNINVLMPREYQVLFDPEVLYLAASNNREKGDLFFVNHLNSSLYKVSIKSLVPTNKEINFGAFEFLSTIKDIEGLEPLLNIQERNRSIDFQINGLKFRDIGLGSSKKLKNMWGFIQYQGKEIEYLNRFKILLETIYKDDFLIYIKDPENIKIYLLPNFEFINIVLEKIKNGFSQMRMEGNAIRITDLELFKKRSIGKFEFSFDNLLPNKTEIINILNENSNQKSELLRRFYQ
jgi:hypothetical protein